MRRVLMASTGLWVLAAGTPALAQTVIDTKVTTPLRTATAKAGAPDNIQISDKGSVTPAGGTAVTIDSNNSVSNAGTIQITDVNDAVGIAAQAGVSGEIKNTGKIILDETYTPSDADKDGDLDGPFAQGSGRVGIRTGGAFTGAISNAGEITVEGNDSAGIRLGGPLTGAFTNTGKINVLGDRAVGVRLADTTGDVTLGGSIVATGVGAVGARLDGNLTGALVVQGTVAATGYRYTTAPGDASKLDPEDLLQGGPALLIAGDVSGGIVLSNATDKVADVVGYGGAPAMLIGAAGRAVAIGPVAGTTPGAGLQIAGKVSGIGVYAGVASTALQIGGLGGAVTIANGISVGGTVQATAVGANATAIRIGPGASAPVLTVAGTVSAAGGAAAALSTGVFVEAGASLPTIRNSGTIRATASGKEGSTAAILDRSGTLTAIENSGAISATGADPARNVAIDLSLNTSGATVRQVAPASGSTAPTIAGAVLFGSGNDTLELTTGTMVGDAGFGAGANRLVMGGASGFAGTASFGAGADAITIDGTARFEGGADFGGGQDTLSIAGKGVFIGRLANAGSLAVTVASGGGTFGTNGPASIGSLALGDGSILSVALDRTNPGASLVQVAGATTIGAGSKLALRVTGGDDVVGRYVVLRSGTLTGAGNLSLSDTAIPFLYKGVLGTAASEITLDIARRTKSELGFNAAQAGAFDAIDAALAGDAKVAASVRGIYDGVAFRAAVDQLLPNFAGGVFEAATLASRATTRQLQEPAGEFSEEGGLGFWLAPVGWNAKKGARDTIRYDVNGWGIATGVEHKTAAGNFGLAFGYLKGRASEGVAANRVDQRQYELSATWRGRWGGFAASARAGAARVLFDGQRFFEGTIGSEKVSRQTRGDWNGILYSAAASLSYELPVGAISLRPVLAFDYYRLDEDAYRETGGGKAVDLIVRKRSSDELAVTASLAAGLNFGGIHRYDQWSRIEVEAGRRERIAGALGSTTASFADGTPFTIDPEARTGGWVGKIRAITGTSEIRLSAEGGAEQRYGNVALTARAALQFAF